MSRISDRGVKNKSLRWSGKAIAFAVCGGIGAVESVKLIRELRRHGATVAPFFTNEASRFISPLSVEWAAGNPVMLVAGPEVDHLEDYDLVIVAPATVNTISKSALGLADNPVTLLLAAQLGRKAPILFVPTMNERLRQNPAFLAHTEKLKGWGAKFLEQELEEDRLKMPSCERLVEEVGKIL
jgi:phosphopantothenoylcysteine decarboxylase/phosphopantothenate--cysteine ligase